MDLSLATLLSAVRFTLVNPRQGARMVMQAGVSVQARWLAFALVAVASAILAHASFALLPADVREEVSIAAISPFVTVVLQGALMLIFMHAIVWIGRMFGGTGQFDDVMIVIVWSQFVLLALEVAQIAVQLIAPPLAAIVGFASILASLWLVTNFIAEAHQFPSVGKTFFGLVVSFLAVIFVLALILMLFTNVGMP